MYFLDRFGYAFFADVPIAHLLKEFNLVDFVVGPTHMKDIWARLATDHVPHHGRHPAAVVVPPAWKVFFISVEDFNFESKKRAMLV